MRVLITSGTGTIGRAAAPALAAAGARVRVLTRSTEHAAALPAGIEGAVGDLQDRASLAAALAGVDKLLLVTPLHPEEAALGCKAVEAARAADLSQVVLLGVHRAEEAPAVPHFASKLRIERALRDSGLPWTVLTPNVFDQNDLWYRDLLLEHGVYPQPLGEIGSSRVDVRDVADAAVRALTEDAHLGRRYPLVGPEVLGGSAVAEIWARHLGRPVVYGGDDLEAWASQARLMLPPWLVDDLATMYGHLQAHGLAASEADLAQQSEVLGHPPRPFEDFAAETAQRWLAGQVA